ncbi:MAG: hypothetical protein FD173_377 [Gallionellaceae bacterium]|nr:MAG: hypothetical protein FD173_377 [Gallionellaceae bacterium]
MKKITMLVYLLGASALVSQSAMASGLKVRGGATNNDYSTDFSPAASTGNPYAKSTFSGTAFGATWLIDDSMYIDYAMSSGSGTRDSKLTNGTTFSTNLTRTDNAIVFGNTSVGTSGTATNVYFGWKTGETKMDAPSAAIVLNPTSRNFSTSGFIFGGGVGIPAAGGSLGLSLGMGLMSGKYDTVSTTTTVKNAADMALGFSLGIGYSYPFTPNFGIAADYKYNSYNYVFDSGLTTEWSLNEKLSTTGVSLWAKF